MFPAGVAVVAFDDARVFRVDASSRAPRSRGTPRGHDGARRDRGAGKERPRRGTSSEDDATGRLAGEHGGRLRALHGVPIVAGTAGAIALLTDAAVLEASEWALLGAFADQAARALERARAFEHEHELAVRLQRSLLPTGCRARRASASPATTSPAATRSRSAATGTTPSSGRTGSSSSASATSAAAASAPRR